MDLGDFNVQKKSKFSFWWTCRFRVWNMKNGVCWKVILMK
jgi:hypothetical protein